MIQSVRGTKDILPEDAGLWQFIEKKFSDVSHLYGYKEIRTPVFERTEVFSRSIGQGTDIVNKEMYTFTDKGGDSITLRPEMTAAMVRAVVQNSLLHNFPLIKLWYFGPFFRYERPQKGRLRQFHQYGAECLGSAYPEADAELIILADSLFKSIGISSYKLLLNTLGTEETRKNYVFELVRYLKSYKDQLSNDSRNRLESNPLRILDSKDESDSEILKNAPVILEFLDNESKEHFENVITLVKESGINFEISSYLVRGLDYYNHTVFEFQSNMLGAQDSFGGGGRYNNLIEQLGGPPTPAVGFALGIERLLMIIGQLNNFIDSNSNPHIYVVSPNHNNKKYAIAIAEKLRRRNLRVITDLNRRSLKSQMKDANKNNVKYVVIAGDDEIKEHTVTIKNMENSEQCNISFDGIDNYDFDL